ncbi:MAG: hypothetical protein E4H14_01930 [Candidatus Thorarchaeota archaeon]|nr:MAG: hypothetical protein E4H14_01930 [Candidatus Thorarchaeota archaeon]
MTVSFHPDDAPTFCVIAPTAYVPHYSNQSRTHLVLAHIVDTDPTYAKLYKEFSDRGDRIIMDNGAFELGESYAPDKLIDLAKACGGHAIVLPDYPSKHSRMTIEAAEQWIPMIRKAGFSTMFVPQSEVGETEDWVDGYMWAADNPDIDIIGMSILAIPNALPHVPAAYARVVMSELLLDRGVFAEKYHHYLGLNAGPKLELPALIKAGTLNSCDSSGPVWSALLGHEYSDNTDSFLAVSKVKAHVDFNYPWVKDKVTLERIQRNLNMTFGLFE